MSTWQTWPSHARLADLTPEHPWVRALDLFGPTTNLDISARVERTALARSTYSNLGIPGTDYARARRATRQRKETSPKYRMDPAMRRANNNMPHQHPVASAVEQFTADDPIARHLARLSG